MAWYVRRSDEELEGMDGVEVAMAPYRVDGSRNEQVRSERIRKILFPLQLDDHPKRRPTRSRSRSPSPPPPRKRACIPASTDAIRGLTEVVPMNTMDDGCAICLKSLAAGKVVIDDEDYEYDDLKALAAVEDDDDDDDAAVDEKKATDHDDDEATVTWLRPLRLRAMPCSHVFHQHCIFKWLSRNRNAGCPLCRHKLPTTDDDDYE